MIPLLRVIIDSCDEEGCDHDNGHSIVSLLQHRNGKNGKDGNDERTCSELSSIEIKPTLPNGVQVSDDIPISNSAAVVPNILVITHQT